MKYVCLGFFDEAAFGQIPQADAERMMEECFAYDDLLRRGGHFLGGEALDSARNAVTLAMKEGKVEVTDEPGAPPENFDLDAYASRSFGVFQEEAEDIVLKHSKGAGGRSAESQVDPVARRV